MKENFFESFKNVQQESKERKIENLNPAEFFFKKENEFFDRAEEKILKIPDSKEKISKFQKLKTLALTTTIALGIVFGREELVFGEKLIEKSKDQTAEVIKQKEIEKSYETYLKIKEILTSERIKDLKEKIEFLKEAYKGQTDFPDYSRDLEKIQSLPIIVDNLFKSGKGKEEIFTSEFVKSLIKEAEKWIPLAKEEKLKRAKKHKVNLKLEGKNDKLKEILEELLSKEDLITLLISVDEIRVVDIPPKPFGSPLGGAFEPKKCFNEEKGFACQNNTITIYPPLASLFLGGEREIIIHEIGHANDWIYSRTLSIPEKIDLFYEATKMVENHPPYFLRTSFEFWSQIEKFFKNVLKMDNIEDCKKDESCLEFLKKGVRELKEIGEEKDVDTVMIEFVRKHVQSSQNVEKFFEKLEINPKKRDSKKIESAKKSLENLKEIFKNDKYIEKLSKEEKDFLINLGFKVFQTEVVYSFFLTIKNIKVKEYWAEGLVIYLNPERKKNLPKTHREFFEKWYKKIVE